MTKNLFLTGSSSGLGLALTQHYLENDWQVTGCSRSTSPISDKNYSHFQIDLSNLDGIPAALEEMLSQISHLDLVILNAGILGKIQPAVETTVDEINHLMTVNAWANKVILDSLWQWSGTVDQIIMLSSGAAVSGSRGWGGYALSKAALNMLAKQYAHEFQDTHISAIAPGLIKSVMTDYLCKDVDSNEFPAITRIREAKDNGVMLSPEAVADQIFSLSDKLREYSSGDYVDLRQLTDPEAYRQFQNTFQKR